MATRADAADRQKLADLPPGPDLILEGEGDIWHITDTPRTANVPSNTMRRAIFHRRILRRHSRSLTH